MSRQLVPTRPLLQLALSWATLLAWPAGAQTAQDPVVLESIVIEAGALATEADVLREPALVLDGVALSLHNKATLGESLAILPGVHQDTFGAGASRPVIRGQSGARVPVLQDGSAVMDASAVSPDHSITVEPMLAQRLEVLRGPAALLYAAGAIGGVVNVSDDRIANYVPEEGVEGFADIRGQTGSSSRAGAFGLTAGEGNVALRVQGLKRRSSDYQVPAWVDSRVRGSWEEASSGSLGISWVGDKGYLGLAYTYTDRRYGLPGHLPEYDGCHPQGSVLDCAAAGHHHDHADDLEGREHDPHDTPFLHMKSNRLDLRGELYRPFEGVRKLRLSGGLTDYRHDEIEAQTIVTTFKNRAYDMRVEAEHEAVAGWQGIVGVQTARSDFRALGEESFLPPSRTDSAGVFVLEQYPVQDWVFKLGARHDWQSVRAQAAQPTARFSGASVSGAVQWDFAPAYTATLTLSQVQRLPSVQELYADGMHMATNTYELGNAQLDQERARGVELNLRRHAGDFRFSASVFYKRIHNYIYADTLDRYEDFRLVQYAQADARFAGLEASADYRFSRMITATLFGDLVRGRLTGGKGDLPRIPAARAGLRVQAKWLDSWSGELEFYRMFGQNRVAVFEERTPGYNMLNASLIYHTDAGGQAYTVYLRANNLFNQLAYNHSSFIKYAAPLPGRQIMLGMRMEY